MLRHAGVGLLALFAVLPGIAWADHAVDIRQGRHGDMGRLVFKFSGTESFQSHQNGSLLTIAFTPAQPIGSVALHIPGVIAMQGGSGVVRLQAAPGVSLRVYRLGDRVIVDTSPQRASWQAAKPQAQVSRPPPGLKPLSAIVKPTAAAPAPIAASLALPAAPTPTIPPAAITAAPIGTPAVPTGNSPPEIVNFATQPGAAAFRRGDQAIIVFDTSEVPDISALQSSPLFASATLLSLQDAQVISLPLPVTDSLSLSPVSGGWQVAAISAPQPVPAPAQNAGSAVDFAMKSANQSIIISDPLTGGDLLVGTVTQAGDAADYLESGPGYAVLPAWLGVVIVPQADDLGLNASLKGFELVSDAPNGLPLGALPPAAMAAAAASAPGSPGSDAPGIAQTVNLPRGATADLWRRLIADQQAAALLPPLGRLDAQLTLARDMLALGMGPEAIGVLDTAVLENPAAEDNSQIADMRAIGDVLSHRSQPADFTAPGVSTGTELAFWQAVGGLEQGQTEAAIPALIAGLALFETYPDRLRDAVGAEIAEALADTGQIPAATQLVGSDPGNPDFDLARAKILERQGQLKAALAAYQALAASDDDRVSAIAGDRMIELRHQAGQLKDAAAADALDAQLFDWRAPEHERHLRLRIAELRGKCGQWMQAFTMLESARALFPDHQREIDAQRSALFLNMLQGEAFTKLSPIEAVAVLQQNQDLIPAGSTQVINLLAQRLAALDLPGIAAPILSHLVQTIPPGTAQATLGATLAQVDLDAGSPVAALADLSQTQADGLPPELMAQRNMLAAKAQAAAGNAVAAVNTLAPVAVSAPNFANPPPLATQALAGQAQIAEQSGQWPQAEQALAVLVGQSVPAAGPIDTDQENLLLRLATAASHNNDSATLAALASQYGSRVGSDAAGQMFDTLTAPPMTGDQGLNQALHEISQLQALPAMVDAVASSPAGATP